MNEQENERKQEGAGSQKELKVDAKNFLQRLPAIEPLLQRLLTSTATGSISLSDEEIDVIGGDHLYFMGWCTLLSWEKVSTQLDIAGLSVDEVGQIQKFADNYRRFSRFFVRMHRTEQGFENEFTHLAFRPILHLKGRELLCRLEIYSHDKLVVVSCLELDDLVTFARLVLETVRDSLELARKINEELASQDPIRNQAKRAVKTAQELLALLPQPDRAQEETPAPDAGDVPASA